MVGKGCTCTTESAVTVQKINCQDLFFEERLNRSDLFSIEFGGMRVGLFERNNILKVIDGWVVNIQCHV